MYSVMILTIRHALPELARLNNMNETTTTRVFLVRRFLRHLAVDSLDIYDQYAGQVFCSGLSKQIAFREFLINDSVSDEVIAELGTMCADSKLSSFRDNRSAEQYATELMLGWIVEDALCIALSNKTTSAHLAGSDKFRDFLAADKITTDQDIIVSDGEHAIGLEVVTDYSNYWSRTNTCDMRYSKINSGESSNSYILGISLQQPAFFFASLAYPGLLTFTEQAWHEAWGKPVRKICGISKNLKPVRTMVSSIEEAVLNN